MNWRSRGRITSIAVPNDSGHIRSPAPAHIHHVVTLCPYTYSYYSGIIMILLWYCYGIVMVLLWLRLDQPHLMFYTTHL